MCVKFFDILTEDDLDSKSFLNIVLQFIIVLMYNCYLDSKLDHFQVT